MPGAVAAMMRSLEVGTHLFGFVKCFDALAAESATDNFYMEREWRTLGSVTFSLSDVRRLVVPRPFFERLREKLPAYSGELIASPLLPESSEAV